MAMTELVLGSSYRSILEGSRGRRKVWRAFHERENVDDVRGPRSARDSGVGVTTTDSAPSGGGRDRPGRAWPVKPVTENAVDIERFVERESHSLDGLFSGEETMFRAPRRFLLQRSTMTTHVSPFSTDYTYVSHQFPYVSSKRNGSETVCVSTGDSPEDRGF